jgi:hypothetical protein
MAGRKPLELKRIEKESGAHRIYCTLAAACALQPPTPSCSTSEASVAASEASITSVASSSSRPNDEPRHPPPLPAEEEAQPVLADEGAGGAAAQGEASACAGAAEPAAVLHVEAGSASSLQRAVELCTEHLERVCKHIAHVTQMQRRGAEVTETQTDQQLVESSRRVS